MFLTLLCCARGAGAQPAAYAGATNYAASQATGFPLLESGHAPPSDAAFAAHNYSLPQQQQDALPQAAAAWQDESETAECEQCGFSCGAEIGGCHGDSLFGSHSIDDAFFFGGWLQQGVTFNPDSPDNRSNAPLLFNDRSNDYQLNQLYLFAGKQAAVGRGGWDFGWRLDLLYGTDSRFLTVPGIEENPDRTNRWNSASSDYGVALPQAFVDLATPIGPNGSIVRVGRFNAQSGYENFTAPSNFFYSRSYTYAYGAPFTYSGAMWLADLDPTTTVAVAATRGWDSFDADNDEWGLRGSITRKLNQGRTLLTLNAHIGDDFTGITNAAGAQSDKRLWVNAILKQHLNRQWYYVIQGDYGRQDGSVLQLDTVNNTVGFSDGQWYGVTQHLVRKIDEAWSAGLRVEWFRDEGNSRVGVPIEYANGGAAFLGGDYFAVTAGLNYRPRNNVLLRPEIRWDYSDVESNAAVPGGVAGIRPFNDRGDSNQLTLALDLVLTY